MNANLVSRHTSAIPRAVLIFLLPCLFLAGTNSALAQLEVGLNGRLDYIENPLLLPVGDQHDILSTVAASITLERDTQRFYTNLDYTASKLEYREDLLRDTGYIVGAAMFSWKIVPDQFNWDLENTRTNQLIDIFRPDIQDNRQVIHFTATGPSANLLFGLANSLQLSAQYAFVNDELSPTLDQKKRQIYNTGYTRSFSSRLSGSLNASFDNIDFNESTGIDYRILTLSASATLLDENYEFSIEAGEQRSERAGLKRSDPVLNASVSYTLNSRLIITAQYSDSLKDPLTETRSFNLADLGFEQIGVDFDQRFAGSSIASLYRRKNSTFGARYAPDSSYTLAFRYSNDERSFLDLNRMEADESVSFNLRVPIGNRLSIGSIVQYSNLERIQTNRNLNRKEFQVSLTYLLTNGLSFMAGASDSDIKGDTYLDNYHGRNYFLSLSYRRKIGAQ